MSFRDGFTIFHTADLERAAAFYVEQLGFEEVYRFEDAYVALAGPLKLGLAAVEKLEPAGRASIWLYCDDVDVEVERLRASGAVTRHEPEDMEWGERMAMVLDPDGNTICIAK
jgi:catechol 2,3-dioxygenase-like lactoylglutathione lyase family enzyme